MGFRGSEVTAVVDLISEYCTKRVDNLIKSDSVLASFKNKRLGFDGFRGSIYLLFLIR